MDEAAQAERERCIRIVLEANTLWPSAHYLIWHMENDLTPEAAADPTYASEAPERQPPQAS